MAINLVIAHSQQAHNACKAGDTEQQHMWLIAQKLYEILKTDNRLNVYLIPNLSVGTDIENLKESVKLSNAFINKNGGKGYHVELHSDAGGGHGCTGIYKTEAGKALVTSIYNELAKLTTTSDRGLSLRNNLHALNATISIACLLEVSFHDNATDAKWIHDNIANIANALAEGIYKAFNFTKIVEKTDIEKAIDVLSGRIINSGDYWKDVFATDKQVNKEFVKSLIIKTSSYLKEGGGSL